MTEKGRRGDGLGDRRGVSAEDERLHVVLACRASSAACAVAGRSAPLELELAVHALRHRAAHQHGRQRLAAIGRATRAAAAGRGAEVVSMATVCAGECCGDATGGSAALGGSLVDASCVVLVGQERQWSYAVLGAVSVPSAPACASGRCKCDGQAQVH